MGVVCLACIAACASMGKTQAPAEWDGLQKRDVRGLDLVFVRPNVQFPPYRAVMLDPVQVEFSKNWDPNSSRTLSARLDAQDLQRIKDALAGMARDGFSAELSKGGYSVTDTPSADTIRVSALIAELYIAAPDTMSPGSRSYTTDAGSMELVMEVRDAPTGLLLARVIDRRSDTSAGNQLQWTNSVTNRAAAQRMISVWASHLRAGLDRLNGKAD
jgi:Protein of unknown function (DUF3313)